MNNITKVCGRCKQELSLDSFNTKRAGKGIAGYCKICAAQNALEHREKGKEFLMNYLSNNPCVDCGESNIVCLEFDHITNKKFKLSCYSRCKSTLVREIKKCQVRCGSCHRRMTHIRRDSLRYRFLHNNLTELESSLINGSYICVNHPLQGCKNCPKMRARKQRLERYMFIFSYLKEHPCVDCGESDLMVLEFDHVEKGDFTVTSAMNSHETFLRELARCQVRCGSCHRKITYQRANTFRYQLVAGN